MTELKELREKLKAFNATALAELTGVPRHAIYRIIRNEGAPKYLHVAKLLEFFKNAQ